MKGLFYAMLSLSLVVALDAIGIIDKAVTGTSNNLKRSNDNVGTNALDILYRVGSHYHLPALDYQKQDAVAAAPRQLTKRAVTTRLIDQCPQQGEGHIPMNATKVGASWRTLTSPQSWKLECFIGDRKNRKSTNLFSYRGRCMDDEICFDQYRRRDGRLHPLRALCASNAPFTKVSPPRLQIMRTSASLSRYARLRPEGSDQRTAFEHLQVVVSKFDDRRALFTLNMLNIQIWDKHGGDKLVGEASCEDCNLLEVGFSKSTNFIASMVMRMPDNADDTLAIYGLFSA